MTDDIGQWYEDQRKKANEIREKLKQINLTVKEKRKLKKDLELALYVGD